MIFTHLMTLAALVVGGMDVANGMVAVGVQKMTVILVQSSSLLPRAGPPEQQRAQREALPCLPSSGECNVHGRYAGIRRCMHPRVARALLRL